MKEFDLLGSNIKALLLNIEHDINLDDKDKYFKTVFHKNKVVFMPNLMKQTFKDTLVLFKKKAKVAHLVISDQKLEYALNKFLVELYYRKDREKVLMNIYKLLKDFLAQLKSLSLSTYLVMVPLINVYALANMKIGFVEILNLTEEKIKELNSKYEINLILNQREDEKKIVEKIQGDSRHPTISLVIIESSDSNKAEQLAIQATEQALNVLRFYIRECRILIKGEEMKEIDRTIVTCNLTNKEEASEISERCNMVDPDYPDEIIDNDAIYKLNEKDLEIVSSLLTKSEESLTPLQKDILTAIYWIGNAEKDSISHDKLIKYVIALDTVLAQGRSDKSETVARRYTGIMCQNWGDADIIQRYCMIKMYYSIRNQIVHGGLSYVDENIHKQLRLWVSELVYNLLSYSSKYRVITDLFKNLFPIDEELLSDVKCEDNLLTV